MKQKCIIVNRVSSAEQKEGYSLAAQSRLGKEYAVQKGFELVEEFTFQESASKSTESKLFDGIMAFIYAYVSKARQPLHVIVEKPDRWGRIHSRNEQIQILIKAKKVILHYYRETQILDHNSTPTVFLVNDISTSVGKFTSSNIGLEAKKGMVEKAKQGWLPHKPPAGYANNPDKNSSFAIIINENERKFIERLFDLRGKGQLSYSAIVETLKKESVVPKRLENTFRKSYVEKLLKNRFYRGKLEFGGVIYEGKHERIVTSDLTDLVDQMFQKSGRTLNKHNGLFSNLLMCGECGCKISFHKKVKNGREYRLYICANGKRHHQSLKGLYKKETEILNGLGSSLDDFSITNDFAKDIAQALNCNDLKMKEKLGKEKQGYEDAIQRLNSDEDKLYEDYRNKSGILDEEFFNRNITRIRNEKKRLTDLLFEIQSQASETYLHTAMEILELAQNAKELWNERNDQEKVEFLNKILWNPRINGSTIEYSLKKPFQVLSKMRQNEQWGEQRGSNPQPSESQSDDLPIDLCSPQTVFERLNLLKQKRYIAKDEVFSARFSGRNANPEGLPNNSCEYAPGLIHE